MFKLIMVTICINISLKVINKMPTISRVRSVFTLQLKTGMFHPTVSIDDFSFHLYNIINFDMPLTILYFPY